MIAFPLSAVVGQERLVEALLVNAVSPDVGGVLVRGERGTAKSTAVRGLAAVLPAVRAAADQPASLRFGPGELAPAGVIPAAAEVQARPAPLVELPLGASLDRVVGSLDLARALAGEHVFEPGLLARAHRGILYVDEVNLLPDHLVDALLDAAASGIVRVERESVSIEHAARFVLVGTMNPEEGELRPQLLDRFGLGVQVTTPVDPGVRAEIVRRRLAFEADPAGFAERFAPAERDFADRIAAARERLGDVVLPERELGRIVGACASLGLEGVRGDIVTARAARALAALDGIREVTEAHVRRAAALALAHRRRSDPLDGSSPGADDLQRALDAPSGGPSNDDPSPAPGGSPPRAPSEGNGAGGPPGAGEVTSAPDAAVSGAAAEATGCAEEARADAQDAHPPPESPARERRDAPVAAQIPAAALRLSGVGSGSGGRRARSFGPGSGVIDSRPRDGARGEVALVASLLARLSGERGLREPVRAGREGTLICLVVDASGSMGARARAARVKGALLGVLRDAYARRDRVCVIAFRDASAQVLVAPGAPLKSAAAAIRELPTGGRTPLVSGLALATEVLLREASRETQRRRIAMLVTDGRVTERPQEVHRAAAALGRAADAVHVVDTEEGPVRVGLTAAIAQAAGGEVHRLSGGVVRHGARARPAARRAA